jgi:hypothetical protein
LYGPGNAGVVEAVYGCAGVGGPGGPSVQGVGEGPETLMEHGVHVTRVKVMWSVRTGSSQSSDWLTRTFTLYVPVPGNE